MNSHIVAATAAAATVVLAVGCATPSTEMGASPSPSAGSTAPTESESRDKMCETFRSYAQSRGRTPTLEEECIRQMGVEACRACLPAQ